MAYYILYIKLRRQFHILSIVMGITVRYVYINFEL